MLSRLFSAAVTLAPVSSFPELSGFQSMDAVCASIMRAAFNCSANRFTSGSRLASLQPALFDHRIQNDPLGFENATGKEFRRGQGCP